LLEEGELKAPFSMRREENDDVDDDDD